MEGGGGYSGDAGFSMLEWVSPNQRIVSFQF